MSGAVLYSLIGCAVLLHVMAVFVSLVSMHTSTLKDMFSLKISQKYHHLSEPETVKAERIVRLKRKM